jgi:hypothetical protein
MPFGKHLFDSSKPSLADDIRQNANDVSYVEWHWFIPPAAH